MFTPRGKFGWYELMTSDPQAAGNFYSHVVGWTTQQMPGDSGTSYTTFNLGSVGMAGMMSNPHYSAWIGYISVDDVDAHIPKIIEAGGKLWKPATDVPGVLRFAVMSDPQDAPFVVFTPNPAMPSPDRPAPPAPGTIGWHELHTTNVDAAFDFYSKLFGWTKLNDMDMGPMGIYRLFDQGDQKPMGDGGIMTKAPETPTTGWKFYFDVESINAAVQRVTAGGGKILHGPAPIPGGGWIVQAQDPQGALFSLACNRE